MGLRLADVRVEMIHVRLSNVNRWQRTALMFCENSPQMSQLHWNPSPSILGDCSHEEEQRGATNSSGLVTHSAWASENSKLVVSGLANAIQSWIGRQVRR